PVSSLPPHAPPPFPTRRSSDLRQRRYQIGPPVVLDPLRIGELVHAHHVHRLGEGVVVVVQPAVGQLRRHPGVGFERVVLARPLQDRKSTRRTPVTRSSRMPSSA